MYIWTEWPPFDACNRHTWSIHVVQFLVISNLILNDDSVITHNTFMPIMDDDMFQYYSQEAQLIVVAVQSGIGGYGIWGKYVREWKWCDGEWDR